MLSAEENALLTSVGAGTPCGELYRQTEQLIRERLASGLEPIPRFQPAERT